jgi:HAE1 family hydrophobic/amphiphilic exporter-1
LPAGYTATLGGSVNSLNTAIAALMQAIALSLILEYMLLVALYESWFYPLVLMCAVPLGLFGSFMALFISGNTINMFSLIGMIMAFGLVAKNGILLVDFTNTLRSRGMARTEALREAVKTRLRPILMTSATMVAGMFPIALKFEPGAESRAPMAVVVIGAIAVSTLLAVFVLPAIYTLFDDLQGLLMPGRWKLVSAGGAAEAEGLPLPAPLPSPSPIPARGGVPATAPMQLHPEDHPTGATGPGLPEPG